MARIPFKLRSQDSSFKEMGSSPVKQGALIQIGKALIGPTARKLGYGGLFASDLSAKPTDRSSGEHILRTIDEWGPTLGTFSRGYDLAKKGKAKIPKGYYQKGGE